MISGPQLPYNLFDAKMLASPEGNGVILVGGKHDSRISTQYDRYPKSLIELQEGSKEWKILDAEMKYPREGHVALAIPESISTTCREDKIKWNLDLVAEILAKISSTIT